MSEIVSKCPEHSALGQISLRSRKEKLGDEEPAFEKMLMDMTAEVADETEEDSTKATEDEEAENPPTSRPEQANGVTLWRLWPDIAAPAPNATLPTAETVTLQHEQPMPEVQFNALVSSQGADTFAMETGEITPDNRKNEPSESSSFDLKQETAGKRAVQLQFDVIQTDGNAPVQPAHCGQESQEEADEAPGRSARADLADGPKVISPSPAMTAAAEVAPAKQILAHISSESNTLPLGGLSRPQHSLERDAVLSQPTEIRVLRMKLRPEELGDVEVTLRRTAGEMKIHIAVTKEAAAEALRRDLSILEDRMGTLVTGSAAQTITIAVQPADVSQGQNPTSFAQGDDAAYSAGPREQTGGNERQPTSGKEHASSQRKGDERDVEDALARRSADDLVV